MNNMPPVTKNLLIINALVALASVVLYRYGIDLFKLFGLHFIIAPDFYPHQLVTYMFLHGGYAASAGVITGVDIQGVLMHLFFNMFALWMFGRVMEQVFGSKRFLIYYMVCGIGAGICQEIAQAGHYWLTVSEILSDIEAKTGQVMTYSQLYHLEGFREQFNYWSTVGASGAVYGILLSFGMSFPNERMFIIPIPVPIKAKFFVVGYAVIELFQALTSSGDGVAHVAHLGGMLFGFFLIVYWRKHGRGGGTYMGGQHWDGYEIRDKKSWWERTKERLTKRTSMHVHQGDRNHDEMDKNERHAKADKEIDAILDKVKKHGYGALSEEEKRKLFNASGRK